MIKQCLLLLKNDVILPRSPKDVLIVKTVIVLVKVILIRQSRGELRDDKAIFLTIEKCCHIITTCPPKGVLIVKTVIVLGVITDRVRANTSFWTN